MTSLKQRVETAMNTSLYGAKDRSRAKGLPLDITIDWLLELAEKQDFCCALTGIQFFAFYAVAPAGNPYVPSLDRIDPNGGKMYSSRLWRHTNGTRLYRTKKGRGPGARNL